MNVFGFLATIAICGTFVLIRWLLGGKPITFKIIKTVEPPKPPKIVNDTPSKAELEKLMKDQPIITVDREQNEETKLYSMDNVIKSVNELMGIQTEEDKDGGKE
jgi:hypothetical protein